MKQAMIFAAGLGTRLRPLTDTMPKALVPVGGQPLLWHVIQKLKTAGFGRIVINVHHFAQQIVDYVEANNGFGLDIRFSDETGGLLETGGGIKKALPHFEPDSPVLIHNVDILSNADISGLYQAVTACGEEGCRCDALLLVSKRTTKRYLLFDEAMRLQGWTNIETGEVRSPEARQHLSSARQLAFSGIHVLAPHTFPLLQDMPERFGIMDFYLKHCGSCTFRGSRQEGLRLLDVGKADTLQDAENFINTL